MNWHELVSFLSGTSSAKPPEAIGLRASLRSWECGVATGGPDRKEIVAALQGLWQKSRMSLFPCLSVRWAVDRLCLNQT